MQVIERGWLSANNIVFQDAAGATLIDTGYCTHIAQTQQLLAQALGDQPLKRIINTHLHSDHCGGNAALQAQYGCEIWIPPGETNAVKHWDAAALSYDATAQDCPPFMYDFIINSGDVLNLEGQTWQALAAPGHDPHSLIFFCADSGTLISADALWENGFGVVFPQLDGVDKPNGLGDDAAFKEVANTLDLIASLDVKHVIPGHGAPFTEVQGALKRAYQRLDGFVKNPDKHRDYAVRVLMVYYLMANVGLSEATAKTKLAAIPYVKQIARFYRTDVDTIVAAHWSYLLGKGSVRLDNGVVIA